MFPKFTRAEILEVLKATTEKAANPKDAYYNYIIYGFAARLSLDFFEAEDKKFKELTTKCNKKVDIADKGD